MSAAVIDITNVLQNVLSLPLPERSYIAERLLVSLDDEQELSPAWRAELDARGLKEHLKPFVEQGHINKWAIPTQIALVTDIPKTSVGKLDKKRIRLDIAQWQAAGSTFLSTL